MGTGVLRWSCARCKVSAGRIDGMPTHLPDSWTQSQGSTFCLACSRALAGEAATDSAPPSSSREELVRIRRNALIEFELERAPSAPNRVIAHACHTSAIAVASIRRTLAQPADAAGPGAPSGA